MLRVVNTEYFNYVLPKYPIIERSKQIRFKLLNVAKKVLVIEFVEGKNIYARICAEVYYIVASYR